jgi:predicted nucleotidyltransferase
VKTQSKDTILGLLRAQRSKLEEYGVRRIGLFGSFAHGTSGPESDVDILVEFEPVKKSYDNFIHLAFYLEEILGRRVELVTTESLSPYIGPRILDDVEYVSLGA